MNAHCETLPITPVLGSSNIKDLLLQARDSQIKADTTYTATSPYTANTAPLNIITTSGLYKKCRDSEARHKRGSLNYNTLEAAVQGLLRRDLLNCLKTY